MIVTFDNDGFCFSGTEFDVTMQCLPLLGDKINLPICIFPDIYFNGEKCGNNEIDGYEIYNGIIEIKISIIKHEFDFNGVHKIHIGFDFKGQFDGY